LQGGLRVHLGHLPEETKEPFMPRAAFLSSFSLCVSTLSVVANWGRLVVVSWEWVSIVSECYVDGAIGFKELRGVSRCKWVGLEYFSYGSIWGASVLLGSYDWDI